MSQDKGKRGVKESKLLKGFRMQLFTINIKSQKQSYVIKIPAASKPEAITTVKKLVKSRKDIVSIS